MKTMKELQDEQERLIEEIEILNAKLTRFKNDLESISDKISELKDKQDYGSFKFVHDNIPLIIQKIATKHKVPPPREINISSGSDTSSLTASVPWDNGDCSDDNPCNVNICPRCTLLNFQKILGRLLAGYYSK